MADEEADLRLPKFDVKTGNVPSLFLSTEEALRSFRKAMGSKQPMAEVYTHLSKFVFLDVASQKDDGSFFLGLASNTAWPQWSKLKLWQPPKQRDWLRLT